MPDAKVYSLKRKKCGFKGCAIVGRYTPILILPTIKTRSGAMEVELQVEVCERHRRNPRGAFLSDEGYRHILKLLRKNGYDEIPPISTVELWFKTDTGLRLPWSATDEKEPA